MNQLPFLNSVYRVIEHITQAEMTNTSKKLVINYINESVGASLADRAHYAIVRYTQTLVPAPEEVRAAPGPPGPLERLILAMERQARELQQS
ncbi:MAG: hypothetical protein JW820_15605 [Spirochaetales bacterium]|nr:hypothetical protein [Spirochaetales bacterium]